MSRFQLFPIKARNLAHVRFYISGLQFHLQFAHKIILVEDLTPPEVESPKLEVNDVIPEIKETVKKERRKKVTRSKSDSSNNKIPTDVSFYKGKPSGMIDLIFYFLYIYLGCLKVTEKILKSQYRV